jgi:uncharacterized protein DUF4446
MFQTLLPNIHWINLGLAILLAIFLIIAWVKIYSLDKVRKQFYSQSTDRDLESIVLDQGRLLTTLNKELRKDEDQIAKLIENNKNNYQKAGFIRFNPFNDTGGNMSFVIALLDAHDNGIIISSLHGREGTRIYGKQVVAGKSDIQFTEEEAEAIKTAK